jgi:epoxyqueuosine reductase QueG
MEPNNKIELLATKLGADFFGVADLSIAHDAILEQGGPAVVEFPRAISVGITLFDSIVDQLPRRGEPAVALTYRHHCYDVINNRLDLVTSGLSSALQADGYHVLPVPASQRTDEAGITGLFSHKMAAHLAGLGWIGKSCLLVTPTRGTRVRWATLLTDAPLQVTGGPQEEGCGDCDLCVQACPVKAFTGRPFRIHEHRETRFDASKCDRYFDRLREQNQVAVCGMCLYICPVGQS